MQQGTLRLLLAIFVAYSHFPGANLPINLGVSSVVGFYFLAGYLMSASYSRLVAHPSPIKKFYTDRVLRIFPAFLLVFLATLIYSTFSNKLDFSDSKVIYELFIIPQNYHFILEFTSDVVPPAWSLGAEIQWYLLLPAYFIVPNKWKLILLLTFVIGQTFVFIPNFLGTFGFYFNDSCRIINTAKCYAASDLLGYRLLVFISIPFMLGHLLQNEKLHKINKYIVAVTYLYYILVMVLASVIRNDHWVPSIEVLTGYIFVIPLIYNSLSIKNENKLMPDPVDRIIGNFSYPIFLSHFLAMWISADILDYYPKFHELEIILCWFFTMFISFILVIFQNFVDKLRYSIRSG